jgi:hypothetical protein
MVTARKSGPRPALPDADLVEEVLNGDGLRMPWETAAALGYSPAGLAKRLRKIACECDGVANAVSAEWRVELREAPTVDNDRVFAAVLGDVREAVLLLASGLGALTVVRDGDPSERVGCDKALGRLADALYFACLARDGLRVRVENARLDNQSTQSIQRNKGTS